MAEKRRQKLEQLAALRKSGKSSLSAYEVDEGLVYDEVEEEAYRSHYQEDDFVEVNDTNSSYAYQNDYDDIGSKHNNYYSDDDDDANGPFANGKKRSSRSSSKMQTNKRHKVEKEESPPVPVKNRSKDITEMFKKTAKPKPVSIVPFFSVRVDTNIFSSVFREKLQYKKKMI